MDCPIPAEPRQHERDFTAIQRACATDSQEKMKRLRSRLRATPLILIERPGVEGAIFRKPSETYFGNDELRTYFSGNDSFACVSRDYPESARVLFEDLGVEESVRVRRKESNRQGYVLIADYHGWHERGLNGFDPDIFVDGLECAIAGPTPEKSELIWNKVAVPNSACIRGVVQTSTRQTYENCDTGDRISDFGHLLIETAWLPRSDGSMHKPSDLALDDLPKSFIRDENLAHQLGMKMDVVTKLAEEAGVPVEDIELIRQYAEEFKKWKAKIAAMEDKPEFPTKPVKNRKRRQAKLTEHLANAPQKEYELRVRSIRVTEATAYTRRWLKEQYTNELDQLICQICRNEMPFKKRDGEYFFEAIEALAKDHFSREHEAQFIALCPLCAAMYKEFVKSDDDAMRTFKDALMNSGECEVSLALGEVESSVRFVETHLHDLMAIIEMEEQTA